MSEVHTTEPLSYTKRPWKNIGCNIIEQIVIGVDGDRNTVSLALAFSPDVAATILSAVNRDHLFDEMVKALETAQAALSDWAVTYAVDEFPGDAFKEARKRIAEHSGTLGYIADVSSAIRSVLSRIQDATDKPGRSDVIRGALGQ